MTRSAVFVDRLATLLVAVLLIAGGAAIFVWNKTLFDGIPEFITAPGLVTAANTAWWPWATTGVGIVLIVLALRWLISHRPAARVGRTALSGSTRQQTPGRSTGDVSEVASASARALEADPSINKASGKAIVDRRRRTLDIVATAASPDLLAEAVRAADRVASDAVTMIGDDTLAARTLIRIDTRHRNERHLH